MTPSLVPIVEILELDTRLFEKALADLDREALVRRIVANSNPIIWIAGHLTWARFSMAGLLDAKLTFPFPPVFGRGAVLGDEASLPHADEVLSAWRDVSDILADRLSEATEAQLMAPSPRPLPIGDKTILGMIAFLTYHEGYHIGQLALLRKALGLSGLVDA